MGTRLKKDDEFYSDGKWHKTAHAGIDHASKLVYRRRLTPQEVYNKKRLTFPWPKTGWRYLDANEIIKPGDRFSSEANKPIEDWFITNEGDKNRPAGDHVVTTSDYDDVLIYARYIGNVKKQRYNEGLAAAPACEPGYRYLEADEILQEGDEYLLDRWIQTGNAGREAYMSGGGFNLYRREKTSEELYNENLSAMPYCTPGYRYLNADEVLMEGDELLLGVRWVPTTNAGVIAHQSGDGENVYRRRVVESAPPLEFLYAVLSESADDPDNRWVAGVFKNAQDAEQRLQYMRGIGRHNYSPYLMVKMNG
jgi:hypothetical protein